MNDLELKALEMAAMTADNYNARCIQSRRALFNAGLSAAADMLDRYNAERQLQASEYEKNGDPETADDRRAMARGAWHVAGAIRMLIDKGDLAVYPEATE